MTKGKNKTMSLRILLVSDHYPPFIGGAHRQTQLLGRELHSRGHTVGVVTAWQSGLPPEEDDAGVQVYRLKEIRTLLPWLIHNRKQRHHPPYPDPVTVWGLRRLINRFRPDIIHSYGWFTYSLAVALLGKEIPLLLSARDYGYTCATRTLVFRNEQPCAGPTPAKCLACATNFYGAPKGWLAVAGVGWGRLLLKRKVQSVHSISTYVQEMVHRDFLRSSAPESGERAIVEAVIPSFREDEHEDWRNADPQIKAYVEQLPKEAYILFVGALRRVKGVDHLLAAYERLVSPPPLVLIGTFEADSPRSFPPNVYVLPNFPHPAVMEAWERALFGVIPSLWPEPLGSVVYEGMSRGKALIGTKPGGHTDMISDGETGILVPQGDVDALAHAMQGLLDKPELRRRLGEAGRERAKQFTADVNVPRFEQLYQQLVNRSAGHAKEYKFLPLS